MNLFEYIMIDYLKNSFKVNGIEGTLETIEKLSEGRLKNTYISLFWKILKKEDEGIEY